MADQDDFVSPLELSWPDFIRSKLLVGITNSSVNSRLELIEQGLIPKIKQKDFPEQALPSLLRLIFLTYPRYQDHASRRAILKVFTELFKWNSEALLKAANIAFMREVDAVNKRSGEFGPFTTSESSRFVVLTWVNHMISLILSLYDSDIDSLKQSPYWPSFIKHQAVLYDGLLASKRKGIRKGAITDVRRVIRKYPNFMEEYLSQALSVSVTPAHRIVALVGTIVDVSLRVSSVKRDLVEKKKEAIVKLYLSSILSSKQAIPSFVSGTLRDFFFNFISEEEFKQQLVPTMERMLLRSPEVALNAISDVVNALNFDLGELFSTTFAKPIISSFQSSNVKVRNDAISLFKHLSQRSHSDKNLSSVAQEMIKMITGGKVSNADQRSTFYQCLSGMTTSPIVSIEILDKLGPQVAKESNENIAAVLISSLGNQLEALSTLPSDQITPEVKSSVDSFMKLLLAGLKSNKPTIKKSWTLVCGSAVWKSRDLEQAVLSSYAPDFMKLLLDTANKIYQNPIQYPSGPLEGYIAISVAENIKHWNTGSSVQDSLSNYFDISPKPSFFLMDRIYNKLTTEEECLWLVRAVESVILEEKNLSREVKDALAYIFIYGVTSFPHYESRNEAYSALQRLCQVCPVKIGEVMCHGLEKWILDLEKQSHEPTRKSAYRLSRVLTAITSFKPDLEEVAVENALLDLALISHHPFVVSPTDKYSWLTLAYRANINPGKLVADSFNALEKLFIDRTINNYSSKLFYKAAISLASTLTLVNPERSIPELLRICEDDLKADILNDVDQENVEIWKTPEGVLHVDVLKRSKYEENKNRKNYATDKWEEDLRKEIAKKRGEDKQVKLTKEEQATVDAQLAKESKIRKHIQGVYNKLVRGLDIIGAMVSGNKEALGEHLVDVVRLLLGGIVQKGGLLVGSKAVETYISVGDCTSDSLQGIREILGLATLRAIKVKEIPESWCAEPLYDMVIRVLYRLRFATEKAPLSPSSFSYCFPLIHQIIRENGVGAPSESRVLHPDEESQYDKTPEQVVIAIDIISFHCKFSESLLVPRKEMIESLLQVIRCYNKLNSVAKKSLAVLCESMGDTATLPEMFTLLKGLLSESLLVRTACLEALDFLDLTDIDFSSELWVACHEDNEANADLAATLWDENSMEIPENYLSYLLPLVIHQNKNVRVSAAKALAGAIQFHPQSISDSLVDIYNKYKELATPIVPEYDEFGMVIRSSLEKEDPWAGRVGLASALVACAPLMLPENLAPFFHFLIQEEALGDRHESVRQRMLDAGLAVISAHGQKRVESLMPLFESYLSSPARPNDTQDRIRESVVILFGSLAGHLDASNPKIPTAVEKLIETLKTPSEPVQVAVSQCLPPLIKAMKPKAPKLIDQLLNDLLNAEKYAERRGAAYGLAGTIKGCGIAFIKTCDIMTTLKNAIAEKKNYKHRQGALFAFETLSLNLGRFFEPYIIQIIPLLLTCFSDNTADVREATVDASRVIMSKISGHCVKLILPSLLKALEDKQWRTKQGSVQLLGSMAYCAPKQLSISLPTIIPCLIEVLADSHQNVQKSANESLMTFGEVISNPEIQALVPIIMDSLSDPNNKTEAGLTALLGTAFVHYIDAPSLALVMPILQRGLKERSTEVKKKGARIVGNMCSLTDKKDLVPYLPSLLPSLKEVLADPVPDARATAAKALGTMVEKLGEQNFPELVNGLIYTLKTDSSGVDREGAAQGLSEILAGLGIDRMETMLPEIIEYTTSPKSYVREGFVTLLIYLPATFGEQFTPYLGRTIPPILKGLADDSEYVRDASLRAGQIIVTNYATKAVDLLLPELEKGLFDENWRIRHSSVQLIGELLYKITGISANTDEETGEETEETAVNESTRKVLLETLGKDRRDRVLASLFIVRNDVSGVVRQATVSVWKSIVSNTPRTLKEILYVVMDIIINNLASPVFDKRQVAARTLGDMVRKLGESILSEIIPILEKGLDAEESGTRQGVCIGLGEIMATAGKVHIIDYIEALIPSVRKALLDPSPEVREAAAQAFDNLHQHVGSRAIDDILPHLLNELKSGNNENALEALKEIMSVRANVVFPVLIPTLITVPISSFNARALGSLISVSGSALSKRFSQLLTALMDSLSQEDQEAVVECRETIKILISSVDDIEGLHNLMMMLFEIVKSNDASQRSSACEILAVFCAANKVDMFRYVHDWFRTLIALLNDKHVMQSAWKALDSITKSMKKEDLDQYVVPVRRALKGTTDRLYAGQTLPGFCLTKGIGPLLPIFLQGLMYGSPETREQAALGIGDLVQWTSSDALKPFVTQITGPLIRIIGDRFPPQVKAAILQTLGDLLNKVSIMLKPFLPQLQRTFIKCLSDPTPVVRERAAVALGVLITLQSRVDPLVVELNAGIKANEGGIRETMLKALEQVIFHAAGNLSDASKQIVEKTALEGLSDPSEMVRETSSKCLGSLCKTLPSDQARPIISNILSEAKGGAMGPVLGIKAILEDSPVAFENLGLTEELVEVVAQSIENPHMTEVGILAADAILSGNACGPEESKKKIIDALMTVLGGKSTECKRLTLRAIKNVAKRNNEVISPYIDQIVPTIMACVKERSIPVKLAGERAMLYLFQLPETDSLIQTYIEAQEPGLKKTVSDYYRRVLVKLADTVRQPEYISDEEDQY
ncbi:ARM repeat-containing protein [Basidiobolus meristosporus CBS 931.73]|uniref:eIF-2-alpha kinase activator GCN1 n=1 Tax=Basidiobolus meristosporus CBS 931.73 TaxID=1314790 RepID=A0A1Y1YFR0_9FUNG|nr:ARM repeat-containing protein [Basidiobolus meristosporus CBS 931.73]|eukprot:ORX96881.1 ARM repeat-containing protein [Basidiobolus meristosporus CBS 931.73]